MNVIVEITIWILIMIEIVSIRLHLEEQVSAQTVSKVLLNSQKTDQDPHQIPQI